MTEIEEIKKFGRDMEAYTAKSLEIIDLWKIDGRQDDEEVMRMYLEALALLSQSMTLIKDLFDGELP